MKTVITGDDCVVALKKLGGGVTAKAIAAELGTTSRAVATAMRTPLNDGRVGWGKWVKGVAVYTLPKRKEKAK
jgi:hypothetical protein